MKTENIIREKKGTIIDLRSREEFRGGDVSGSGNIPLEEIQIQIDELKKLKTPFILCCASRKPHRDGNSNTFAAGI